MRNENEFWLQAWKDQNIFFNQSKVNEQLIKYHSILNLNPNDLVFVPLCGKSIDMLWLAQTYRVLGVELSPIACETFFEENHLQVTVSKTDRFNVYQGERITILSGDFFDLDNNTLKNVRAVYDRAALVALPGLLRNKYVQKLHDVLSSTVDLLLITVSYNQSEMDGPPYSVNKMEVHDLFNKFFKIHLLSTIDSHKIPLRFTDMGLKKMSTDIYHLTRTGGF